MKKFLFGMSVIFFAMSANASLERVHQLLVKDDGTTRNYPEVIRLLVDNDLYFAAAPYVKEYLATNSGIRNKEIDFYVDKIINRVGVRQFEVLPFNILKRSNAPVINYIVAKKYFREGSYKKALDALNGTIPRNHPAKPFALLLEGSIFSINGNYESATASFKECIIRSKSQINDYDDDNRKRQLAINRDNCIVGIARAQFAAKKYEEAELSYLDLNKSSHIWPEILFEEAWNSFYQKDYNRTLGKLVTYKAPVLEYIFNPEVDVLRALTYLELCLYNDTRQTVDNFYKKYKEGSLSITNFLRKYGKDYKYYYLLAKSRKAGKISGNDLLNAMLKAAIKDAAYLELYDSFQNGRDELVIVKKIKNRSLKKILSRNLKDALVLQRDLIGAYVRKRLLLFVGQINKSFEGMSYISLEISKMRKYQLYGLKYDGTRSRGDIKNLVRNEKQYFWTFNGEFWADELGDYVFSLKSECI